MKIVFLAIIYVGFSLPICHALTNAFTYQGQLSDGGNPADGLYDFRFGLYDAETGGKQVGPTLDVDDLEVVRGYF